MATPTGLPIWYELLTPDIDAAARFYGAITGWTTTAFPSPAGGTPYTILNADGVGIAGLVGAAGHDAMAPGWLAYFHVADVDATVAALERAGGTVTTSARDLPGVGRVAMVADPDGVGFYLMTPDPAMGDRQSTSFSPTLPGRCSWNELVTSDQGAALPFYQALFGWEVNEVMAMGPAGDYTFLDVAGDDGDVRLGAMMNRSHADQPLKWTFYFHVPDADAAAEQVKALGGQVIMGPVDVPGPQRIILALDPQGIAVGFVAGQRQ